MDFEEFYRIVRTRFKKGWPQLTDKEVDDYLESEMVYLKGEYKRHSSRLDQGEITLEQFKNCGTGGCLVLMY